jgi:hypothetical protein
MTVKWEQVAKSEEILESEWIFLCARIRVRSGSRTPGDEALEHLAGWAIMHERIALMRPQLLRLNADILCLQRRSLQHLSCQIASSGCAMMSIFALARHVEQTVRALYSARS